jgi:hypothetical protein
MLRPYLRQPYRLDPKSWVTEQLLTLDDFSGGLNNVDPDNIIKDNEFTDTKNMRFVGNTLMEKRYGTAHAENSSSITFETPDDGDSVSLQHELGHVCWIDDFLNPIYNKDRTVICFNGSFGEEDYYVNFINKNDTITVKVRGKIRGVTYNRRYYFVDGFNLYVFDGTDYYKITTEPYSYISEAFTKTSTKIKVDDIPEQTVEGDKVWFVSSILQGVTDDTVHGVTRTIKSIDRENCTITLSSAVGYASVPLGVKKLPVCFYEPSEDDVYGEEVWDDTNHLAYYKPCYMQLQDSYAGNGYIPDMPDVITIHQNRLFVSGDWQSPSTVYMSATDAVSPQPLYFPSNASVSVKPDGRKIKDLIVFDNALIIGRNEDIYVLYGDTEYSSSVASGSTQFYMKQMDVATGFMNTGCGAMLNNYYIYLGYDGRFYALNTPTTYVEYLMTKPLSYKCDIYSSPFNLPRNTEVDVNTVVYRNEIYFCFPDSPNDTIIVYNYDNMAYTYFEGMKASCLHTDGNILYIGRKDGTYSYYLDKDEATYSEKGIKQYNDINSPIKANLTTKRFDLGMSALFKYFKRFMITSRSYDTTTSDIHVSFEIDYIHNDKDREYAVYSNHGHYDVNNWNQSYFGVDGMNLIKSGWNALDVRGRTVRFAFSNEDENEPMRIYDVNVLWSIRDVR